jgi:hypothetical protein
LLQCAKGRPVIPIMSVGYQAIAASGRDKWATTFSRLVEREIGGFVPPPGYE